MADVEHEFVGGWISCVWACRVCNLPEFIHEKETVDV